MDNPEEDITREHIDFAKSATELAGSRIPEEGYEAMSVNDYIATLTNLRESMEALGLNGSGLHKSISLYSYLRDKHDAQKVADVAEILRSSQVDSKIVDLWIEEGFIAGGVEFDAVKVGYPDKIDALDAAQQERLHNIISKYE